MNKIYNIVWNNARQTWVVAHEAAKRHGKPSSSRRGLAGLILSSLLANTAFAETITPSTLPTGGQVKAGQANIGQDGNTLNINQSTNKAIINWNTFSIGSNATVNFNQLNNASVTLNRVLGNDPSQIYGRLNANGQMFLINPNGVLFGSGARVDVGGLVATTLNIKDIDFLSGKYQFNGTGGSVINQGELYGKYIALMAPEVRNQGIMVAQQGTVALAGGTDITLSLVNNQLTDVAINKADINTLVENKHLIQTDDGSVILSAQSANQLLGKVVNSGVIQAKGLTNDGGKVRLTASSNIEHSGSINVDAGANGKGGSAIVLANLDNPNSRTNVTGSISAKGGTTSGDGGFVETSASHLKIDPLARIDTRATSGKTGQWLLDPYDFTIAASGGDITGTDLGNALNISNVTIQTTNSAASCTNATCGAGNASGNGDIFVNDTVDWSTGSNSLTLDAYRDIRFNASVTNSGGLPGLPSFALININYGTGGSGKAVVAQGVSWTPDAPNIVDTVNSSTITSFGVVDNTSRDYWIGTKNVVVYVQAVSGSGVYGSNTTSAAYFDAAGGNQININSPTGSPVWSSNPATLSVGTTALTYSSGLSSDRYSSFAAGNAANWTVTARPITLTANSQTKTYGDNLTLANNAFSVTSGSYATGQSVASATIASANSYASNTAQGIGTYNNEITISSAVGSGGFVASNYAITYTAGNLTINPATLTYTANAASSQSGDPIPALSGTVTGFVNSETLASATTGALAFNTTATNASPAGNYAVNGGGLTAANYTFVQAAGNATALTITPAPGVTPPVIPPVVPPVVTPTPPVSTPSTPTGTGTNTQVDIQKNTYPLNSTNNTTLPNPTEPPVTIGGDTTGNTQPQPQQAIYDACNTDCGYTGTFDPSPGIGNQQQGVTGIFGQTICTGTNVCTQTEVDALKAASGDATKAADDATKAAEDAWDAVINAKKNGASFVEIDILTSAWEEKNRDVNTARYNANNAAINYNIAKDLLTTSGTGTTGDKPTDAPPIQASGKQPEKTAYQLNEDKPFPQASSIFFNEGEYPKSYEEFEKTVVEKYNTENNSLKENSSGGYQEFQKEIDNAIAAKASEIAKASNLAEKSEIANAFDKQIADFKEKMFAKYIKASCPNVSDCNTQEKLNMLRGQMGMPAMTDEQKKQFPTLQEVYEKFKPETSSTTGKTRKTRKGGKTGNTTTNTPPTQASNNPPQKTAYQFNEETSFPQASNAGSPAELDTKESYVQRVLSTVSNLSWELNAFNTEIDKAKEAGKTDKEIADYKEKMFASTLSKAACETPNPCITLEQAEGVRSKLGMPPMSDELKKQFITAEEAYDRFKPAPKPTPSVRLGTSPLVDVKTTLPPTTTDHGGWFGTADTNANQSTNSNTTLTLPTDGDTTIQTGATPVEPTLPPVEPTSTHVGTPPLGATTPLGLTAGIPDTGITPTNTPVVSLGGGVSLNNDTYRPAFSAGTTGISSKPDLGDVAIGRGAAVNYAIPQDTFTSGARDASLTLSAKQANGQPLPAWLKFDSASGKFTGQPPAGLSLNLNIKVEAKDEKGNVASSNLRINSGVSPATN